MVIHSHAQGPFCLFRKDSSRSASDPRLAVLGRPAASNGRDATNRSPMSNRTGSRQTLDLRGTCRLVRELTGVAVWPYPRLVTAVQLPWPGRHL
jgi:hypothetical protein